MTQPQSKFIPPIKSFADTATLELMRQKLNALSNGRVVTTSGRNYVNYSDGNVVWEVNPSAIEMIFPFKIYQVRNITATDAQKALFTDLGLDINSLTFQIRNGIIGIRPRINPPQINSIVPIAQLSGNYELDILVPTTDEPPPQTRQQPGFVTEDFFYPIVPNTGTCTILNDTTPTTLIDVSLENGVFTDNCQQIVLNQNPTAGAGIANPQLRCAAFWLKFYEDSAGIHCSLIGQMFSAEASSTRPNYPFPVGGMIFPLGWVSVQAPNNLGQDFPAGAFIQQIQTGNLVNRYPNGYTSMNGRWNTLYAALPGGVTTMYWYPGDQVIDDTNAVAWGGANYFGIYQYIGATVTGQLVSNPPSSDAANWSLIGMYPD